MAFINFNSSLIKLNISVIYLKWNFVCGLYFMMSDIGIFGFKNVNACFYLHNIMEKICNCLNYWQAGQVFFIEVNALVIL